MSKILIISDSRQDTALYERSLRSEGYQTLVASNGPLGIKLTRHERPDLVVCNVLVPPLDGYAVLSRLQEQIETAVIPFILWGDNATPSEVRRGMELGAHDYLAKPCTTDVILKAVSTQLSRQKTIKRWYAAQYQKQPHDFERTRDIERRRQDSQEIHTASIFPAVPTLENIFTVIEETFRQPVSLSDIAEATNYSPAYMTHLMKRETGRSVYDWVIERRMVEARKLLAEGRLTVREISLQTGYSDPSYFMRQFKHRHSLTAKAWQKRVRDRTGERRKAWESPGTWSRVDSLKGLQPDCTPRAV